MSTASSDRVWRLTTCPQQVVIGSGLTTCLTWSEHHNTPRAMLACGMVAQCKASSCLWPWHLSSDSFACSGKKVALKVAQASTEMKLHHPVTEIKGAKRVCDVILIKEGKHDVCESYCESLWGTGPAALGLVQVGCGPGAAGVSHPDKAPDLSPSATCLSVIPQVAYAAVFATANFIRNGTSAARQQVHGPGYLASAGLGAGAVLPGTYSQTPQCHLVKRLHPCGLPG